MVHIQMEQSKIYFSNNLKVSVKDIDSAVKQTEMIKRLSNDLFTSKRMEKLVA